MQPYQERVVEEAAELEKKCLALNATLQAGQPSYIDDAEWDRMRMQCNAMSIYWHFLAERIDNFK